MGKRTGTPAELAARREMTEAARILRSLQLPPVVELGSGKSDGYETWLVFTPGNVPIRSMGLPGHWFVRLSWSFRNGPTPDEAQLATSSMSLNVRGITLMDGASTDCLVRYDLDRGNPVAKHNHAHLNIFQPGRLWDRVHYPICGIQIEAWSLRPVLEFFLSDELRNDLVDRIDPA